MGVKTQFGSGIGAPAAHVAELDVVVPFTTPALTQAALDAVGSMASGLNAAIRLIRVQVVPYPLQINESPVFVEFLKKQLAGISSHLPVAAEIRLARSMEDALLGILGSDSVVMLAAPKRPWKTRNERLAAALRRAGHKVVLVNPAVPAPKQETVHA